MAVTFDNEKINNYFVLKLYGDMLSSPSNGSHIRVSVSKLIDNGGRHIVFDFSRLSSPSSDLVSIISDVFKKVEMDKGSVSVIYDPPSGNDVFKTRGVYNYARHYINLDVFKRECAITI